jgi:peptide/nickel transport system substrate-binding protein
MSSQGNTHPPEQLTREEFLRRGLATGVMVSLAGLGWACTDERPGGGEGDAGAENRPRRGGLLRVGSTPWLGAQVLDAHTLFGFSNDARIMNLYDNLVIWDRLHRRIQPFLAEEFTAEAPDTYLIRVREGAEFHDGKPVTADDVIFTFRRIIDPKTAAISATTLKAVDPNGFKKLDSRTVRMTLKEPDVTIPDAMSEFSAGLVPVGFDPRNPVGSGPFKFKSLDPGVRSLFERNPNYWQSGKPYVDELEITSFDDDSARVNALLGGQLDVITHVPPGQVRVVEARDDLHISDNPGGGLWLPIHMRVDAPPFDDNDVRLAIRLIANRPQMVEQALAGFGRVGNDLFAPVDPCYNSELPQREQDLDQARSLLKRAGQENLEAELVTSNPVVGMVEAAQVFAEQARGAGVNIKVRRVDVPTLFGPDYTNWPFAMNFWATRGYLVQVGQSMLPTGAENETHWPNKENRNYISLYNQARRTLDEAKRCEIVHEMQRMEWESGGHLVWGFSNFIDAHMSNVHGLLPTKGQMPVNQFRFELLWFS